MKTIQLDYNEIDGIGQVSFIEIDEVECFKDCKYCGLSINIYNMDNHLQGKHGQHLNNKGSTQCPECGKTVRKVGLGNHLRAVHKMPLSTKKTKYIPYVSYEGQDINHPKCGDGYKKPTIADLINV